MLLDIQGRLSDQRQIRAGFIGCGSHAFRNIYATFQFAPVQLVATCDLDAARADAFARQFGAQRHYTDHREMLRSDDIEAVFVVTSYDKLGRPTYPRLAIDCLEAGKHVWIEKPPARTVAEVDAIQQAVKRSGRQFMCGLKKAFSPANRKARRLIQDPDFGRLSLVTMQYPTPVPSMEDLSRYNGGERVVSVVGFLDHLCHPTSALTMFAGMPRTLSYQRGEDGSAVATFTFESGLVAALMLPGHAPTVGGYELTQLYSDRGRRILVENNLRVSYFRDGPQPPGGGYGRTTDFYHGELSDASCCWEPEFSLGQLYNKGLFIHGYYNEITEFARAVMENRPPAHGTVQHVRHVTRIYEAFAEGPGRVIPLQ